MNDRNHKVIRKTLTESEEDIVLVLRSLANRRRLKMLTLLLKGPSTFKKLKNKAGLGKTALAHHLGQLVETGLLKHTGRGRYELSPDGAELLQAVGEAYRLSRRRREAEAARRADYIQKVHDKRRLKSEMEELKVRIVELEPMQVASVRAISRTPEPDAWQKMREWAEPKGFLEDIEKHPVFGFNNPNPSLTRKDYGYEFWMQVEPDVEAEGDIKIKEFEGGLYVVITCNLKQELESEFFQKEGYLESWKKLTEWVESSSYEFGQHQCLERAHNPDASPEEMILDLYCPIEK
jgi:effector-binding domain-containing protein/DNA-binding HxlR family transcriptional regulator